MKLRYIMLTIMLPMLGLVGFFCLIEFRVLSGARDRAEATARAADEVTVIYALISELQRERGYTEGVLSTNSASYGPELAKQRQVVDAALMANTHDFNVIAKATPIELEAFFNGLADLGTIRNRIDRREATAQEAVEFYSKVVDAGLRASANSPGGGDDTTLDSLWQARSMLAAARESAGREQGNVLRIITEGKVTPAAMEQFIRVLALQDQAIEHAGDLLEDPGLADRLLTDPATRSLQRSRELVLGAAFGGSLSGLTGAEWFAGSSAWQSTIGAVEESLGDRLVLLSQQLAEKASNRLFNELVLILSVTVGVFLFSLFVFERMIRRFRSLTLVMAEFIEGNFAAHVPFTDSRSEMNLMARSIYRFKQETLARLRDAATRKQNDEAVLNARHQRVVDLVTEGLAALAKADLTCHFDNPLDGEYDTIRTDFNTASARLREVIVTLAHTITDLDERSSEMLESSNDLAQRTAEQDQTLRNTTQQVMQLSAAVDAYGQEIISASEMAGYAKKSTGQSSETMRKAIDSMARIEESSKKISQIISLIEDISFQTNLLALNAGVEAARAGESGRGFAVVASEVRDLARRSSQAATEIKGLIDNASREVAAGVSLVDQAGEGLGVIFEKINKMDEVLSSVSRTAEEQTKGLKEFSSAMVRLAELTQENSSMVEQTRNTTSEMAQSSRHLAEVIQDFVVEVDEGPSFASVRTHGHQRAA